MSFSSLYLATALIPGKSLTKFSDTDSDANGVHLTFEKDFYFVVRPLYRTFVEHLYPEAALEYSTGVHHTGRNFHPTTRQKD